MGVQLLAILPQLFSGNNPFEQPNTESLEASGDALECQMSEILDQNPITTSTILQRGGLSRTCHRELPKDPASGQSDHRARSRFRIVLGRQYGEWSWRTRNLRFVASWMNSPVACAVAQEIRVDLTIARGAGCPVSMSFRLRSRVRASRRLASRVTVVVSWQFPRYLMLRSSEDQ